MFFCFPSSLSFLSPYTAHLLPFFHKDVPSLHLFHSLWVWLEFDCTSCILQSSISRTRIALYLKQLNDGEVYSVPASAILHVGCWAPHLNISKIVTKFVFLICWLYWNWRWVCTNAGLHQESSWEILWLFSVVYKPKYSANPSFSNPRHGILISTPLHISPAAWDNIFWLGIQKKHHIWSSHTPWTQDHSDVWFWGEIPVTWSQYRQVNWLHVTNTKCINFRHTWLIHIHEENYMIVRLLPLSGQVLLTPITMSTPKLIIILSPEQDLMLYRKYTLEPDDKYNAYWVRSKI